MKTTKLHRWGARGLAALLAVLSGQLHAADLKIGLLLSQTGPLSSYGVPMKSAAEYAAKLINDAGGVNGSKVVVVLEDDTSNPSVFLNGLNRLLEGEKVLALVSVNQLLDDAEYACHVPVLQSACKWAERRSHPLASEPSVSQGSSPRCP